MSGLKHSGQILQGDSNRGVHDPMTSKINVAVPSRNNLYSSSSENKQIFLPGINEESLKVIAKHVGNKPMKLAVDGKKISRGKGQNMGIDNVKQMMKLIYYTWHLQLKLTVMMDKKENTSIT